MTCSKKSEESGIYAISRIQSKPGSKWWCWSVMFSRAGRVCYKTFYDVKRGGSEQALADAIVWRDAQLLAVKALSMREFCEIKRTSNQSGVPGVQFIRPKGQPLGSWQARLKMPDGKSIHKTFAVKKYGERGAFELAKVAREKMLDAVDDKPFLHHVEAKLFAVRREKEETSGGFAAGDAGCSPAGM